MKNGKMKLLEGGLIGAALGVAAGIYLTTTKSGKKISKEVMEKSAEFYEYIAPQLKKMKKMGEKEYKTFVKNAAENYSKAKKFTVEEAKTLAEEAQNTWESIKKHTS